MELAIEIQEIKTTQRRIDGKLTALLNKKVTETWVPVAFITDLTGWNGERLRQARDNNLIGHRKTETGSYEYNLDSLHEKFIIKKAI